MVVGERAWLASATPSVRGGVVGSFLYLVQVRCMDDDVDTWVAVVTVVWDEGNVFFSFVCVVCCLFTCPDDDRVLECYSALAGGGIGVFVCHWSYFVFVWRGEAVCRGWVVGRVG